MSRTTVFLPLDLQRRLRDAAERRGRPQAELVREALEGYLEEEPPRLPRFIGIASDGALPAAEAKRWAREQVLEDSERRADAR